MDRVHWLDVDKLIGFILSCQDERGGISDRPDNQADVFHLVFGVCGLSMLDAPFNLKQVNAAYALPQYVLDRMGIKQ